MADKMEITKHFTLATQCMDFFKQFSSQGMAFTISLSMGLLYHFFVDTNEKFTTVPCVNKVEKRNDKRRKDVLMKNTEPTPVTLLSDAVSSQSTVEKQVATIDTFRDDSANLENTSKHKNDFKCEMCEHMN